MTFTVRTQFPVAYDSLDHLHPFGTIKDNSSNSIFVKKTKELGIQSVLDIGCAGGGLVEELLANKISAIGLEGSDISKKARRAAWATIPNNLFTADATKPFMIKADGYQTQFDMVTCWEFFEHIKEEDLPQLLFNIYRHTHPESLLICSITSHGCYYDGVDLHRTQQGPDFWLELFAKYDFHRSKQLEDYYAPDWVRVEPGAGCFNLALKRKPADDDMPTL